MLISAIYIYIYIYIYITIYIYFNYIYIYIYASFNYMLVGGLLQIHIPSLHLERFASVG